MTRTHEVSAARKVVETYIRGTAQSDAGLLRSVFHPNAIMSGYLGPDALAGGPEPFLESIAARPVEPAYRAEITELDVIGKTATAVLVEDNLYDLSFVTKLHLLKIESEWIIVSKLFHHD